MNQIPVTCPSCGFSRQVPYDRVPAGTCTVTCPKCKTGFTFSKPAAPPQPSVPEQAVEASETASQPPQPPQPPTRPQEDTPQTLPPPAGEEPAAAPQPPPRPRRERPAPKKVLPDIGTLFSRSWTIFQQRFAILIGLYLLAMVAFIIPPALLVGAAVLAGMAKGGVLFVTLGALGALAGLYCGFSCFGAFLHAVADSQLPFRESLEKGRSIALPLLWVGLLTGFIISGGFLLFIIPGIIFTVWFFFAQFVLVNENLRGIGSLLKCREYVRGEWFNVALRLLLVWAGSVLLGIIPLVGPILSIAFLPYVMIFHYLLYRDLADLKGDIPYSCGTVDLLKWPGVALAGYIIVPAAVLLLVGGAALGKLKQLQAGGITISPPAASAPAGSTDNQGYRVIDFPRKGSPTEPGAATGTDQQGMQPSSPPQSAPVAAGETPDNIHVFIYSANYTGTVRANGAPLKEIEGKPDVQYNYNLGGDGLKYGENRIDLDYAEVPAHQGSLLEVHIRISRNTPGKGREILGEWRLNEKGSGTRSYTFEIPK